MKYSEKALYNKFFRGSFIDPCNNDCGKNVFGDVETNTVRNAVEGEDDILHKDDCMFLKNLRTAARSFNYIPSFSIDDYLDNLFDAYEAAEQSHNYGTLISAVREFRDIIGKQKAQNREKREEWNNDKKDKVQAKRLSSQGKFRQQEQQSQWDELLKDSKFRMRWRLDDNAPEFVTGDRLL